MEKLARERSQFAAAAAHELRTPLAGLEGYPEGLLDGVLPSDPETISAMQHELRRLHRLVDDLQQLSRVEAGQVPLRLESVDLLALARRVVAQLRPQLFGQCLDVVSELGDQPLLAWADADRTAQILINLVGNAIRYTPDQGEISVRLTARDGQAQVAVVDTGVGIPAESLPYIFERFYRVDPSRSRTSGGSGIGLTIARHLAWSMGGDLVAASAGASQGSCFTLTLPLAEPRD